MGISWAQNRVWKDQKNTGLRAHIAQRLLWVRHRADTVCICLFKQDLSTYSGERL